MPRRLGWEVLVDDVAESSASDLQWAAFDALLAEIYEIPHAQAGDGVPINAIEEGLRAHAQWDAADHGLRTDVRGLAARRSAQRSGPARWANRLRGPNAVLCAWPSAASHEAQVAQGEVSSVHEKEWQSGKPWCAGEEPIGVLNDSRA